MTAEGYLSPRAGLLERSLVSFILFYGALVFCLPVPSSEEVGSLYPWWANKVSAGNVQLYELLFLVWILLYGARFLRRAVLYGGVPTRQAAIWLSVLALWCGAASLTAPLVMLDLGRTLRLLLNGVLLLAVVQWTRQMRDLPPLILVLGFFVGTAINLYISFQYPLVIYETMRLSGQNTPGVAMAVAVHLCAWMFFRSSHRGFQLFSLLAALAFVFGAAISYSRIAWFVGGLGLVAWCYVLVLARPQDRSERRRLKRLRLALVPVLVLGLVSFLASPVGQEGFRWVEALVEQKISGADVSNAARWSYVTGTGEILLRHPLGVGYSGFYDAMTATGTYRKSESAEEVSVVEANPHATFLWYATAGGIPGAFLAAIVFVMLLNSMRFGLISGLGKPGSVLFTLAALSFLVIGLTVPYLFSSIILIVPAAIAAGWGWSRRLDRLRIEGNAGYHPYAQKTLRSDKPSPTVF